MRQGRFVAAKDDVLQHTCFCSPLGCLPHEIVFLFDGGVEERYGMATVLLRLDFIGQAAEITVNAEDLDLA